MGEVTDMNDQNKTFEFDEATLTTYALGEAAKFVRRRGAPVGLMVGVP